MKILRVIASMDPTYGGPCQGIRNIIPELSQMGIQDEVVCLNEPEAFFVQSEIFPVYALGKGVGPWGYCKALRPWLECHMGDFDVVIIHGLWQYYGYVAYDVWRMLRIKRKAPRLLVMPHGMLDPYFQKARGRRLKAIRNKLYWKFIESKLINQADAVLFTCQAELELARQTFPSYTPQCELNVGYGIAPPPPYEEYFWSVFQGYCPNCQKGKYILFLSRIHEKKGVDLLIKAYKALGNIRMDLPDLVIAGPGLDTHYGHSIKKLAEGDERIHLVGMLKGDAKWGAFYGAQAFVLPSHQENFGIAVVEALACRKPVLITNKVNIWQEINRERAGLVDEDTANGLFFLLKSWLDLSDVERREMEENAKQVYAKYFSVKEVARNMKRIIETEIIQDSKK